MTSTAVATIPSNPVTLSARDELVLKYVRKHEGRSPKSIAEQLKLAYPYVAASLGFLFRNGLVTKQADESDGRKVRYFPTRERHVSPPVNFSSDHQTSVVYTPGSEQAPGPKPDPETAAFNALTNGIRTERGYEALGDALKVATKMLDLEVQKPENYDLVLTFHLGGVIVHLSKILKQRGTNP